jgi:hypothetical protein
MLNATKIMFMKASYHYVMEIDRTMQVASRPDR